jgi:crotonobetainyl-CoA:carnitine CoA-transferase CaiB-like acyl-CoA transferase
MTSKAGPLAGIRVLDLSRVLSGPWAGQMLGDLGAEVIKVEQPGLGDMFRTQPPQIKDKDGKIAPRESALYLAGNRNKKSVTVNISSDAGCELVRKLALKSDVLIENFRAGTLRKRGLDYEALSKENPRLIYCSISGFGQTGPYADKGGYDSTFQALSGMMSYTGQPDGSPGEGPVRTGPSLCDINAGMYGVVGILTALYSRVTTGRGQYIDLAMLDTTLAMVSHQAMAVLTTGKDVGRSGNSSPYAAPTGVYPCSDKSVMFNAGQDKDFKSLCETLGSPELVADERYASRANRIKNRRELDALIGARTRQFTSAELIEKLEARGLAIAPVNSTLDAYQDPQVVHRNMLREIPHPLAGTIKTVASPLRFSDLPMERYEAPPLLGQHTDEVLAGVLGLDAAEIQRLREAEAI